MSHTCVRLDRKCRKCGMKFKQYASFVDEKGRITIKVWQYKCPFCEAHAQKPTEEEIREEMRPRYALRLKEAG